MPLRTVVVLALVLSAQSLVAQAPDVLRGLRSVSVTVAIDPSPTVTAVGLDTTGVRVQVELALRRAGIRVSDSANTEVHLNFLFLDVAADLIAYSWYFQMLEWVAIPRRPAAGRVYALTWESAGIATSHQSNIKDRVQETVRHATDGFLNDYLAANPPRRE